MSVTTESATRADVLAARALVAMGDAAGRPVEAQTRELAQLDPTKRASRQANRTDVPRLAGQGEHDPS
ncbi:hypothetical protein AB2L28_13630 [Kineococcus sp. TBRC 1896]|uniref:Uncharacterized protein n=1 Tax=Kineococcus mangrovi TaxID=1660183 RepID=A0ABV4I3P1_9ACTN